MRASSYQSLLDGLEAIDAPDEVKKKFAELLRWNAAKDGFSMLERRERVAFALHLVGLREERTVIRDRLMARFQISRSQAYWDISEALQSVQKLPQKLDGRNV